MGSAFGRVGAAGSKDALVTPPALGLRYISCGVVQRSEGALNGRIKGVDIGAGEELCSRARTVSGAQHQIAQLLQRGGVLWVIANAV